MLTTTRTAQMNGQSKILEVVGAHLNANIQADGSVSIIKTIPDVTFYNDNKTAIDADVKSFEEQALLVSIGGNANA